MTILINVINQELRLATPFRTLVNGTQEFIKFKFVLDDAWLKITTFAQFIQDGIAYNVYLDDNKCVFLPREINSGTFTLMLYGTGGHVIGTSNYLTLKMIDNIFVGDAQSTEITESLYTQLVNIVNSYGDKIDAKVSHSEYSQLVNRVNILDNTIKDKIGTEEFESFEEEMGTKIENVKQLIGTPLVAQSSSKMTDKTKIYIYTGNETGYQNGYWYYYDGTAWTQGGVYNSVAINVDDTLSISGVPADAKKTGDELSDLKSGLSQLVVPTIRYSGFIKGQQIQTYQVGRTITFKTDSTNTRAINKTPIHFDRKTFLVPPTGYEAYICRVTADDNLLVQESTEAYASHYWVAEQSYIIMQVRRTDRAALSADDMAVINAWIDFHAPKFSDEDIRRMVATKKSYYDGTGTAFGNNHNNFTLAHITDIHADVFRYENFRQFVDDHADLIDVAVCTGDLVDLQNDEQWDAVNGVEGTREILQVVGNHDRGHQAGDTLLTDEELVAKFDITTNTGMMYYYRDFGDYRIIVLNQFEADVRSQYKYSEDELTWLLSTLDNSITANKHVIIACHMADTFPVSNNIGFYQRYNRWLNKYPPMQSGIEAVIDAFKRGTSVSTTVSGISVSHTFSAAGDFLCWICGHYHGDYIGYSETYPDQLYLMGNCGACTSPFKGNMGETNSDLARISGTPTEDCFNIYSFDLANRLVKVARIGANINDRMTERKMAVYSI